MRIKPSVGSVVGPTNATRWGQVLLTPHAYGVVEVVEASGGTDSHAVMQKGVSVLAHVTEKLAQGVASLKDVETIADEARHTDIATVLLLVPVGKVVYVVLRGAGAVYVKRGDALACLFTQDGAVSGEVKVGDTLLLASRSFTDVLSEDELTAFFDHLSASEAAEKLTLLLHEKSGGDGGAAFIFQVTGIEADDSQDSKSVSSPTLPAQPMEKLMQNNTHSFGAMFRETLSNARHTKRVVAKIKYYFMHPRQIPRKAKAAVAIVLLVVFLTSVGIGIFRQRGNTKSQAFVQKLSDAQHAFDEGVALLDLNPVKGREKLTEAKGIVEELSLATSARTQEGRELATLGRQISDNLTQAMQVVHGDPQLFFDVSLLKKGSLATAVTLADDVMGIVDRSTQTVYALTLATKNGQIVAGGPDFASASFITSHGDKLYVFVDGGIHEVRISDKKTTPTVIKKDDKWQAIAGLVSFGGNIYLLDKGASRIWKYIAADKGFSDIREYLNPDTLPKFDTVTGMAIDGSIWMGTTDGTILRFTQGKENTFVLKGVDPAFGQSLVVYTSDATKYLYVLDTHNKRVVVLDKDGAYMAQYAWSAPLNVTNLAVSEKLKTIFLLADGKIYSLGLK